MFWGPRMILHAKGRHKKTVFFSEKIQKGGGLAKSKRVLSEKNEIFRHILLKRGDFVRGGLARFFLMIWKRGAPLRDKLKLKYEGTRFQKYASCPIEASAQFWMRQEMGWTQTLPERMPV